MSELIYEASVYSRKVTYRNFKGEVSTTELYFALDPLQLMGVIAGFKIKTVKSGNPAKAGKVEEISNEESVKFVRDLASKAAGFPSDDGESWEPFPDFADSIAGKAFLTKLAASDSDREEFAQKVVIDPFKAFVHFAEAEADNSPQEIQQFKTMLAQLENVFSDKKTDETLEERKARLAAELESLGADE